MAMKQSDTVTRFTARSARCRGEQDGHESRERKGYGVSHPCRALVQIRGLSWRSEAAGTFRGAACLRVELTLYLLAQASDCDDADRAAKMIQYAGCHRVIWPHDRLPPLPAALVR